MRPLRFVLLALLTVTLLIGAVLSRRSLRDARWREPFEAQGASPVIRSLSLHRTREVLRELTREDPVLLTVGTVARDTDGTTSLHVMLHNRGRCVLRSFRGVAYGFDARGEPSDITADKRQHVVLRGDGLQIAPGGTEDFEQPARASKTASLVVAHIDFVECADGTRWSRR